MIRNSSIVVISNINFTYTNILLQRLIFRLNRGLRPKLLIIIEDEDSISDDTYNILGQLNFPFFVVKDKKSTPFLFLTDGNIPNFNEAPFSYLIVDKERDIEVEEFQLAMDSALNLIDNHIHSELAYCSENMDVKQSIELGKIFGLKAMCITEHSNQLYFDKTEYRKIDAYIHNVDIAKESDYRVGDYLALKKNYEDGFVHFGLELDFDFNGNPIMATDDLAQFDYILGAIHQLTEVTSEEFLLQLDKVLKYGIDVLAHPFRIFKRNGKKIPMEIIKPTVTLLKKHNTAAEINFHTNEPPVEFIRECLQQGVKLSLGSDAHNLAEIGDFSYHLDLLKEVGYFGDLKEILWVMNEIPTIP